MENSCALRDWRNDQGWSATEVARRLGVHLTTIARIENGETSTDADMVARIEALTGGLVTAADMHATRLAWLKANRPEKFPDTRAKAGDEALPGETGRVEPVSRRHGAIRDDTAESYADSLDGGGFAFRPGDVSPEAAE